MLIALNGPYYCGNFKQQNFKNQPLLFGYSKLFSYMVLHIYKWCKKFQINNKIFHGIRNCVHIEGFFGPDYDQTLSHLVKKVKKEISKNSLNCVTRTIRVMYLIYILCITMYFMITCAFTTSHCNPGPRGYPLQYFSDKRVSRFCN